MLEPDGHGYLIPIEVRRKLHQEDDYFPQWWKENSESWPWGQKGSWEISHVAYAHFEDWWDKDKFVYDESTSTILAGYCFEHFDTWWDPNRFYYSWGAFNHLAHHCSKHFKKWWNSKMIKTLEADDEAFWDYRFDESIIMNLVEYCGDSFRTWFDPSSFNWKDCGHLLKEKFEQHRDLWEPYYVENML